MTNSQKNSIKKYLNTIKKNLYTCGDMEQEGLRKMESDLSFYADENTTATYDELVDVFGAPEEISANYIRGLNAKTLCNALSFKKCVLAASMVTIFAAILCAGFKGYLEHKAYVASMDSRIVTAETTLVIYEPAPEEDTFDEEN